MYVPRRMRTHYYRSRAEAFLFRRNTASIYERYDQEINRIWGTPERRVEGRLP